MLHSPCQSCHFHRFSYYLLSEGYTGSMLIPGLSLKHQTLTSNDLQDTSTFNFKIIELQVAELGLEIILPGTLGNFPGCL